MTKLQELTKAIHEAVPEILELKKRCRFVWTDDEGNVQQYEIIHSYGIEDIDGKENGEIQAFATKDVVKSITSFSLYDDEYDQYFHDVAEIIGRDITLADVFRVLSNTKKPQLLLEMWSGGQLDISTAESSGRNNCIWNLEQNALHLQSQETIDFLHEIICNK